MPRGKSAPAPATTALTALLAQFSFTPAKKVSLKEGDQYIEGSQVLTVKASTVEQGSGPRPTRHTNAVSDETGKITLDVFEDETGKVLVVLVKPLA